MSTFISENYKNLYAQLRVNHKVTKVKQKQIRIIIPTVSLSLPS